MGDRGLKSRRTEARPGASLWERAGERVLRYKCSLCYSQFIIQHTRIAPFIIECSDGLARPAWGPRRIEIRAHAEGGLGRKLARNSPRGERSETICSSCAVRKLRELATGSR
jgi:hypothetical protein